MRGAKRAQIEVPDSHEHRAGGKCFRRASSGNKAEWEQRWGRERRSPELPVVIPIDSQGSATGHIHSCLSFTVPSRPHHGAVKTQARLSETLSQLITSSQDLGHILAELHSRLCRQTGSAYGDCGTSGLPGFPEPKLASTA